ncbi:MAG: metallophosphoesterase, partial [Opitutaceae bacterium]|nr:metallophosphoesterase [Opitutaceae bacterium]
LLPGDQVDSRLEPLIREDMGAELKKLRAPLGVYAVIGNHERYAGADACVAWMEAQGVRVLRDSAVKIADAFYLVGREDDRRRKSMAALLAPLDRSLPVIVLDHQPRHLEEPAAAGVDLQLSGHTHAGQIWPVTWIVPWLYEFYYGYGRKGGYQIYVTSGLGLWGFPARIGSSSELVDLTVNFNPTTPETPTSAP